MKKLKSIHASSEKRTSDIIEAALECFTEYGYTDTSMTEICRRANASTGSVYHHFKSKEQLAAAVYLEGIKLYQKGMLEIFERVIDPREGIFAVVEYHLKWVENNRSWALFLFHNRASSFMAGMDEELMELNKKYITASRLWFKQHMEAGRIRRVSWDILISILLGPCQEFTKLYLSEKGITGIDEAVNVLSIAAWNSLSN